MLVPKSGNNDLPKESEKVPQSYQQVLLRQYDVQMLKSPVSAHQRYLTLSFHDVCSLHWFGEALIRSALKYICKPASLALGVESA